VNFQHTDAVINELDRVDLIVVQFYKQPFFQYTIFCIEMNHCVLAKQLNHNFVCGKHWHYGATKTISPF